MDYVQMLQQASQRANMANEARYSQGLALLNQNLQTSAPGGALQTGALAEIEKQKTKGVGSELHHMISSGLFNTQTAASTGQRWESNYAAPARLKLEDIMSQRQNQARMDLVNFIQAREDVGPSLSDIYSAAQQAVPVSRYGKSYGFGADASNRPGWGLGTYGTLGR